MANHYATAWTQAPDGDEFLLRRTPVGFALYSYERGLLALLQSPREVVRATTEVANSVIELRRDWQSGPTCAANRERTMDPFDDPRRPLRPE